MPPHDPYKLLLQELNEINDVEDIETYYKILEGSQQYVKALRKGYLSNPPNVDYSDPHHRAAYLLAYYPHYIENVYYSLKKLPPDILQSLKNAKKVRASFFGSGPAPEVLGLIAFIREYSINTESALVFLFDHFHWHIGQMLTLNMAREYWPRGILRIVPRELDITGEVSSWHSVIQKSINNSDILVMQNCLNDAIGQSEGFIDNFVNIVKIAKIGALILIIDLKHEHIKDLMIKLENALENSGMGQIVHGASKLDNFRAEISVPIEIRERLLIREDGLIPKESTYFRFTAFYKTQDTIFEVDELDDIPF
jgi:hypothetical protein